jgi:hypothetical protein
VLKRLSTRTLLTITAILTLIGIFLIVIAVDSVIQAVPSTTTVALTPTIMMSNTPELSTLAPSESSFFDDYIGTINPSIPDGYESSFYSVDPPQHEYYVAVLAKGDTRVLWLEKIIGYDTQKNSSAKVIAILVLHDFQDEAVNVGNCYMDDKRDPEIIAPSDFYHEGEQFKTNLKQAWRANRREMKFEPISPKGIKCESLMSFVY